jgi:nicotinamide riboside kinase
LLKIALVGAPSSRKTELSHSLKSALEPERSVAIVDEYVKAVEERSDLALSHFANYLGNLQVAVARYEHERMAAKDNPAVMITCGTLIETTVYTALHGLANSNPDLPAISVQNDTRALIAMRWLSIMDNDYWDYDLAFKLKVPSDTDHWDAVVEEHIDEAAETFRHSLIELPDDNDERVAKVLESVYATATLDERAS